MSKSRIDLELLSRYVEGDLTQEEQRAVEETLARSSEARRQLESLRNMLTTLDRLPDHRAPEGLLSRLDEKIQRQGTLWSRLFKSLTLGSLPVPVRTTVLAVVVLIAGTALWWRVEVPSDSTLDKRVMIAKEEPAALGMMERSGKEGEKKKADVAKENLLSGLGYLSRGEEAISSVAKFEPAQEKVPAEKPAALAQGSRKVDILSAQAEQELDKVLEERLSFELPEAPKSLDENAGFVVSPVERLGGAALEFDVISADPKSIAEEIQRSVSEALVLDPGKARWVLEETGESELLLIFWVPAGQVAEASRVIVSNAGLSGAALREQRGTPAGQFGSHGGVVRRKAGDVDHATMDLNVNLSTGEMDLRLIRVLITTPQEESKEQ